MSPLRLIGPIFDKELRVSSRRARNYVMRTVYLVLLLISAHSIRPSYCHVKILTIYSLEQSMMKTVLHYSI